MKRGLLVLALGLLLTGCGKHYWEAPGHGVAEFETDSGRCIQEAKSKYEVSERIYRACMRAGRLGACTVDRSEHQPSPRSRRRGRIFLPAESPERAWPVRPGPRR